MMEWHRLEKWEGELNTCIRCGYCYEHCPIFKFTGWESDTPRAKLAMLYGLLHREIDLTERTAQKLFECFYCKRCENSCSSSIPITEIFADVRADLLEAGFDVTGTTSVTDSDRCAGCLACVRLCKHEARSYDSGIIIDRVKCQSCGTCLGVCPRLAISIDKEFGTGKDELLAQIAEFFDDRTKKNAKAIVFCCNWSNYPGLQASRLSSKEPDPDYKVLITMCSGRLQPQLILDTLRHGAWGLLIATCPERECEHDGNLMTGARIKSLRNMLQQTGIDPRRIELVEIAKGDQKGFQNAVDEFMTELKQLDQP